MALEERNVRIRVEREQRGDVHVFNPHAQYRVVHVVLPRDHRRVRFVELSEAFMGLLEQRIMCVCVHRKPPVLHQT